MHQKVNHAHLSWKRQNCTVVLLKAVPENSLKSNYEVPWKKRLFSTKDYANQLLSPKLISSSLSVIPIHLNGYRNIKTNSPHRDITTNDSLLDVYAKGAMYSDIIPNIMTFNFIAFATKFKLVNNKLAAQPDIIISRVFPVYSLNRKGPNFTLHCKYQLVRYKPWQTTQDNAWGDQTGTDEIYISIWKDFLETSFARKHVPD